MVCESLFITSDACLCVCVSSRACDRACVHYIMSTLGGRKRAEVGLALCIC